MSFSLFFSMVELINILKYRFVWSNIFLSLIFVGLSFFVSQLASIAFILLSNLFDIFGYHFSLLRRSNQPPEKIIIKSYRINQFMYDLVLLVLIGLYFGWSISISGWILKFFGVQDILYYLFLGINLPEKWTWMKWTPFGFMKGNMSKKEIIIQSIAGVLIATIILMIK